jgi:Kef-type K+ transport system membrane component KefB
MPKVSPHEILILIIQLAILYTSAKFFGGLLKKIGQPAVVGEILAGIIVGPTVLGAIFPSTFKWLFLSAKSTSLALDGIVLIAIIFLLFIVGLEADLPIIVSRESRSSSLAFLVYSFLEHLVAYVDGCFTTTPRHCRVQEVSLLYSWALPCRSLPCQ